ncbi:MAG: kelch repeat-containing protein [Pirellulaceae bacterium]
MRITELRNHWRTWLALLLAAAMLAAPTVARAHFLWIVRTVEKNKDERLQVYFSESPEPDDPDLLERVKDAQVWRLDASGAGTPLELSLAGESLFSDLGDRAGEQAVFALSRDYGVISRGGEKFLLRYYAKTGPAAGHKHWQTHTAAKHLDLELIPSVSGQQIQVQTLWQGKPVADAQVKIAGPGIDEVETASDEAGNVSFRAGEPGLYAIRVRHIESRGGTIGDQAFDSVRHYATLALPVDSSVASAPAKTSPKSPKTNDDESKTAMYPKLDEPVTSFGAAIADGALYIYGGHTGGAHSYSKLEQGDELLRLDLKHPTQWESIAKGPHLQGLAMVAHGKQLYRVGGFTAMNEKGEEHHLVSQNDAARFDLTDKKWHELPELPEPRSSHDAAVVGDKLYVVGGWQLRGEEDSHWHTTAYLMDLKSETPAWEAIPEPPFQRRAIAAAAHQGKLYVIGGMQEDGGPTTRVDVFDPESGKWTQGPSLQGDPMNGFGSSAFAVGGKLCVSTLKGDLQRLSDDGKSWTVVRKLDNARFFHRMLPLGDNQLLFVGGANMESGKFDQVEVLSAN